MMGVQERPASLISFKPPMSPKLTHFQMSNFFFFVVLMG